MPTATPLLRRAGWLAGLPVLALLWAGATHVAQPVVSDALVSGSAGILRDTGRDGPEPWLRLEAAGRDLLALGEAPDEASRAGALSRLAALPSLRRLIDRTGLIEQASPFVFTLTYANADTIEAGGVRPAEIGAGALAARLAPLLPPQAHWRDRARAARGAPPGFAEAAAYLAARLHGLAPGAVLRLDDTVIAIRGEALDPAAYDAARAAPSTLPPGFTLGAVEVLPPLVADFRFAVTRRADGGTTLDGFTVTEEARAGLLAGIRGLATESPPGRAPELAVEDRMTTARGLPEGIDPGALARFAVRLAGLVREGSVRFADSALSVRGEALDAQAVEEAEALMRDERPAGVAAGPVALTARPVSPYVLRLRREPDRVTLTGYLPDRATRDALRAALRKTFLRETVTDRTRLSGGAPPELARAVEAALPPLAMTASGAIAVSDRALSLTGESLYAESARRLGADLPRLMPPGWQASAAVTAREAGPAYDAQTCARLFAERTGGHPLRFAPGSTELKPDFYPVLDALADLAKACPGEHVEVTGHADPPGAAPPKAKPLPEAAADAKGKVERGRKGEKGSKAGKPTERPVEKPAEEAEPDLARARARAIVDYLTKAGVAPERALAAQDAAPLSERQGIGLALRS